MSAVRTSLVLGAACAAVAAHAAEPLRAEYAYRWDPSKGGPKSLAAATEALGLKNAKKDQVEVRYFAVSPPNPLPNGYTAIGREREKGGKVEATYKVRGPQPLPAELQANCPLKDATKAKYEVDVAWTGMDLARAYSASCTVKGAGMSAFPQEFAPTPRGCKVLVGRAEQGSITVEEWKFPGGPVILEASMKGRDTPEDLGVFESDVVQKLAHQQAVPLLASLTEHAMKCQKQ